MLDCICENTGNKCQQKKNEKNKKKKKHVAAVGWLQIVYTALSSSLQLSSKKRNPQSKPPHVSCVTD